MTQRPKKYRVTSYSYTGKKKKDSQEVGDSHRNVRFCRDTDGKIWASTTAISTQHEGPDLADPNKVDTNFNTASTLDVKDFPEEAYLEPAYIEYITSMDMKPGSRRNHMPGDENLWTWLPQRDRFLEAMMALEGRGENYRDSCQSCLGENKAEFECTDCFNRELTCQTCLLESHRYLPFHRIRRWNGAFYERVTLKDAGLRIQLGHRRGEKCPVPEICHMDDFIILDHYGIHNVSIDFCACGISQQTHADQLLAARFFPATVTQPRTAVTFQVLEAFELLSYESKASAFEYYQTLSRLTDNTATRPCRDRYPVFLRVVREWRHMKMLKRSGRGHDPSGGAAETARGECAVLCPACPHPGKNMDPNWATATEDKRFLHALFLALDANFRLKRKQVSSQALDPGLNHGYAYFVEETAYKVYLEKYKDEVEPKSTCSRHEAVNLSDTKPSRGHAATGVGTVECARHDMKRPNAVGDLQRGERYCNMDYMFMNGLLNSSQLSSIVVSYDIACQWSINFRKRMLEKDSTFFMLNSNVQTKFLVPKFHLPAHIKECRTRFSFNYSPGVGRTDGEAPERGWAEVNPLAASTREMGPGSRRDTLDFHFGDYNWRKVIGLGTSLARKMWSAAIDMAEHTIAHQQLEASISTDRISKWTEEVIAWERDPSMPNPFEAKTSGPSQAAVRRQLSEDEARDLAAGQDFSLDEIVTPSVLISSGMDLEAEQRAVQLEASKVWEHAQDRQQTRVQLRSNTLQRKIDAWTEVQILYIPTTVTLRKTLDCEATAKNLHALKPYELPLWLPSQIKNRIKFDIRLASIEWQLRLAQAHEALESIRHNLQMRAHLLRFKKRNVRGQGANTRARNAIAAVQGRVDAAAKEYRAAHVALISLADILGKVAWNHVLKPLEDSDIRELAEGEDGHSEGTRKISWIWKSFNSEADMENDEDLRDALRVEWCKSRARAQRFREEVELLAEEMRRVDRFFLWQQHDWMAKGDASRWSGISGTRLEALQGYASRQAALRQALQSRFASLWQHLPAHVLLMVSAVENPELLQEFKENELEDGGSDGKKRKKRKKAQ